MTFLEAATAILKETGQEMTAKQLAAMAIQRGMVMSNGKTPDATLAAQLYLKVRKQPAGPLKRIAEPGGSRARRGSVRWAWHPPD